MKIKHIEGLLTGLLGEREVTPRKLVVAVHNIFCYGRAFQLSGAEPVDEKTLAKIISSFDKIIDELKE